MMAGSSDIGEPQTQEVSATFRVLLYIIITVRIAECRSVESAQRFCSCNRAAPSVVRRPTSSAHASFHGLPPQFLHQLHAGPNPSFELSLEFATHSATLTSASSCSKPLSSVIPYEHERSPICRSPWQHGHRRSTDEYDTATTAAFTSLYRRKFNHSWKSRC